MRKKQVRTFLIQSIFFDMVIYGKEEANGQIDHRKRNLPYGSWNQYSRWKMEIIDPLADLSKQRDPFQ